MKAYYVYILTNRRYGVLYVGVTTTCFGGQLNISKNSLTDLRKTTA